MKKTQAIKVYCRLKPSLIKNEKSIKYEIKKKNDKEIICFNFKKYEQFQFQNVFNENTTQSSIFEHVAVPILEKFLNGMNCTIFTYGQTGSGKTHTIVGSNNDKGIIPRSFQYIFTKNAALNSTEENEIISMSYFQVYNEDIYDLIPLKKSGNNKNMQLTERVKFVVNVNGEIDFKNLNIVRIKNVKDALDILKSGNKNRRILSTTMNDQSSRSHCICKITLSNKESGFETILNLVDLAGSERISKNANTDKKTLAESRHINISLLYLHQVINALANDVSQKHVPYRNSIITLLLKGSLGFKCATAMISTIVLNDRSIAESVSTLRYTKDVSGIKHIIEEPKKPKHQQNLKIILLSGRQSTADPMLFVNKCMYNLIVKYQIIKNRNFLITITYQVHSLGWLIMEFSKLSNCSQNNIFMDGSLYSYIAMISDYRYYCILLTLIILNIIFMIWMWPKEQYINNVKFHSFINIRQRPYNQCSETHQLWTIWKT
ncbi:hypothetical protein QTP88_024297 [Uroleucon formosanum]